MQTFFGFVEFIKKLYRIAKRISEQDIKLYLNKDKQGIFINKENCNLLIAKLFYLTLIFTFYLCFYTVLVKYSIAIIGGMGVKYLT